MSNAIMNQVYNHYLTSYAPRGTSRYDAHKRSELRGIYNSIVKMNKEAPLFLMDNSSETKQFAVGIKEQARILNHTISSLGVTAQKALLNQKTAYSTGEDIASAKYIGPFQAAEDGSEAPSFTLEVQSLASAQVNLGSFLQDGRPLLSPGTYSFDVNINDLSYEFQFNINEGDSNLDVQKRLERLVNSADIGIEASIIGDGNSRSALRLASKATGLAAGKQANFTISDDTTSKKSGTVEYFGLNYVAIEPRNAHFTLNGEARSTASNHFTIEKMYEIQLNGVSPEEGAATTIGLKTDLDSLNDNVHTLINGYNSFIESVHSSADSLARGQRLLKEINGLSRAYTNSLDAIGVHTSENGTLSLDDHLFSQSVSEKNPEEALQPIKEFAASLLRKTGQISINPMHYIDKTIVAYKNPGKTFTSPYAISPYSGMLFSSYC